jgi:hypothetical protein
MDPSFYGLRFYNSFERPKPIYDSETMLPPSFSLDVEDLLPINNIEFFIHDKSKKSKEAEIMNHQYIRQDVVESVQKEDNIIESTNYRILLSNIDAIYKLTGFYGGLIKEQIETPEFTFLALHDSSFEMTQYLQFRLTNPKGIVYVADEDEETLNESLEKVTTTYLTPIIDYTSTNILSFLSAVENKVYPVFKPVMLERGVDLVVACPPKIILEEQKRLYTNKKDNSDYLQYLSFFYLLQQLIICLKTCNPNGNFVTILFGSTLDVMAEAIYLVAQCFDSIQIVKPLSSNFSTANDLSSERVLVALGRRSDEIVQPYQKKIENLLRQYNFTIPISVQSETNNPLWINGLNKSQIDKDVSKYFNIRHIIKGKAFPKKFVTFLTKTNSEIQDFTNKIIQDKIYLNDEIIQENERILWSIY